MDPKKRVAQVTKNERFECIPPAVLRALARAMGEGAKKYGRFNWRKDTVDVSTYTAAAMRHILIFECGENIDPDSPTGELHLVKAMASLAVIADAFLAQVCNDDRICRKENNNRELLGKVVIRNDEEGLPPLTREEMEARQKERTDHQEVVRPRWAPLS